MRNNCCCATDASGISKVLPLLLLQVPAVVVLEALAAYYTAVQDVEDRHVGVRDSVYAADIPSMIDCCKWPPQFTE